MLLKWFKLLLIVVLALATVALMIKYLNVTSLAFSLALNFALMFWFTLYESQAKPALISPYFEPRPFEKDGKLYRMAGVELYRSILVKSGWEKLRQQQTPIRKNLDGFQAYERASRVAEVGHIVVGLVVLIITVYVLSAYPARNAVSLIVSNILLNIYPILLQRYTRPRLLRTIESFKWRRTA